jgi:ABC-type antimicrobial peptide transport system permease subunit
MVYIPLTQGLETHYALTLMARTAAPPETAHNTIRVAVSSVSSQVLIRDVRPLNRQIGNSVMRERALAVLSTGFGAVALFLAAVGLSGLLWQLITSRTGELGLRMALGATPSRLSVELLEHLIPLVSVGVLVGAVGAYALGRLVENQLFATKATDPVAAGGAIAVLCLTIAAACAIPLARVWRVDPAVALRAE